jgi:outer membrane receptor protein involved in Fe transport
MSLSFHRLAFAGLLVTSAMPAALAYADPSAASSTPDVDSDGPTVDAVVVTAKAAPTQTAIDRKIYTVSADLQALTGSADNVLRNIPSVELDTLGNVSLRGDSNVQILIDGKPSPMMSAANRGAALQQMGADQIERIEVLTNPSAEFKPDGSAGIINIVTKRSRKPGLTGTVRANIGSEGRFNLGGTADYNTGPFHLYGSFTARQDNRKRLIEDRRAKPDPTTNLSATSAQDIVNETKRLSLIGSLGADYDLTKSDRLSGGFTYNDREGGALVLERDVARDEVGDVTSDYLRRGDGRERQISTQGSLKYRHSFADDGHAFTLDLERGETAERQRFDYSNTYNSPLGPATFDSQHLYSDELVREFTAEYAMNLPEKAKFLVGYDLERDDNDYDNHGATIDPLTGASIIDPALTHHFIYGQTIHALYSTYERPFGKWTMRLGLRLEQVLIDTNDATGGVKDNRQYFRAYPTLHLQYDLSDTETFRLSYSHRVTRPRAEDLDPYPLYQDAYNFRAGNPRLLPQETHSFEAGYQYQHRGLSLQATAYFRESFNDITDVSRYITPTILLTTKENLGRKTSGGVELSASGKLNKVFGYNLSSNIYYNEISASNLGLSGSKALTTATAKASLDYSPTQDDLFQLSATYYGERLTAQGYRLPSSSANIGYRHKFGERVTAVATVTDLFASQGERTVIDTATLRDNYSRRQLGRTFSLGLTWLLGGGKTAATDNKFDYSSGQP